MPYALRWLGRLLAALAGSPDGPPAYDPSRAHLYDLAGDPAPGSSEPEPEPGTHGDEPAEPTSEGDDWES